MELCPKCGMILRIYKNKGKEGFHYRCRNCRENYENIKDNIVLVPTSNRKNAKLKRIPLTKLRNRNKVKKEVIIVNE